MADTLQPQEVAMRCGLSYGQVLAAIRNGTLKARKMKRVYTVAQTEADRFKREDVPGIVLAVDQFVTVKPAADRLDVDHKDVISLIHGGSLKAEKVRGRYRMDRKYFDRFARGHADSLHKLRQEYISLYWQGLTLDRLKAKAREEMPQRGVAYRGGPVAFVDRTIYDHLMETTCKKGGSSVDRTERTG